MTQHNVKRAAGACPGDVDRIIEYARRLRAAYFAESLRAGGRRLRSAWRGLMPAQGLTHSTVEK